MNVVNGFDKLFVNVGPKLAEEITEIKDNGRATVENNIVSNTYSIYLKPVMAKEILQSANVKTRHPQTGLM